MDMLKTILDRIKPTKEEEKKLAASIKDAEFSGGDYYHPYCEKAC